MTGRPKRLELVDSLRAIAAFMIFAYHALFVTGNLSGGNYGFVLRIGVPLFYAISGLLLYRPFAARALGGVRAPDGGSYARRRLFRIVPAYWVALPVVALLLERGDEVFTAGGILTYFGFLQVYRLETFAGGLGQAWTLCVEMSFYLFLPLYAWATGAIAIRLSGPTARLRLLISAAAVLVLLSIGWKVAVIAATGADLAAALVPLEVLPASLDAFAAGMAVAVLVAAREAGVGGSRVLSTAARAPLVLVAVAGIAYWLIGEVNATGFLVGEPLFGREWRELAKKELEVVFAGALVLAAVAAMPGRGVVGRVLATRTLRRAGEVSYGVYLWHLAILIVFAGSPSMGAAVAWIGGSGGLLGGLPGVATAFAVTIAVSLASWELLEKRMIAKSHRAVR